VADYSFKTTPFKHQLEVFLDSRDREFFALLMEQGTGKSKVIVDTTAWLYGQGEIDSLLVVAPNGVHRNWILNELPIHMPEYVDYEAAWYASGPNKKEKEAINKVLNQKGLKIIAINVEALATVNGVTFARDFIINSNCLMVIDESTTIKNPKAVRTKAAIKLGNHAKFRRILTGTPITQGPLDAYTQFNFLDPTILNESSFYGFRNRYAIMKEMRTSARSFMVVDYYVNLDELKDKIAPHSFRVLKTDCLDLPEKLYQKRYVELSKEQAKLYKELKKEALIEFEGGSMSMTMAMTRFLRMQQVIGGFFQPDVEIDFDEEMNPIIQDRKPPIPIGDKNPRIESLIDLCKETQGKMIIWARFRAEIAAIVEKLHHEFGRHSVVEYHGGVDNAQRSANIQAFQNDPQCLYFVGHVQAGGKGLTLHAASTVVYYSNDFSLENRLQSEDRAHRIGQTKNVTYVDMVAIDTLDANIVDVLRDKKNVSDMVTGDIPLENWL
jgi:SNF2 family DNA or RNA helicase